VQQRARPILAQQRTLIRQLQRIAVGKAHAMAGREQKRWAIGPQQRAAQLGFGGLVGKQRIDTQASLAAAPSVCDNGATN
jgi:hypothetical protein